MHSYHRTDPGEPGGAYSVTLRRWRFKVWRMEGLSLVPQSPVRSDRLGRDVLEIFLRKVLGQSYNRPQ